MSTPLVYKARCIVLARKNSGEADRIVTVLCEHYGKKRVIAKGIRKVGSRRASHLEPFTKVSLMLHKGKFLDIVTEATTVINHGRHLSSLKTIAAGYMALEVAAKILPDASEHDEVLELLDNCLSDIKTLEGEDLEIRLIRFIDDTLGNLGYKKRETVSKNLLYAITSVENVVERKLRSAKLFFRN